MLSFREFWYRWVYQNKELVFYLWLANMLILQWMYSEVFPWLGIVLRVGAPFKSMTLQNTEIVIVPWGYAEAKIFFVISRSVWGGQKLAAVRLLRHCSHIFWVRVSQTWNFWKLFFQIRIRRSQKFDFSLKIWYATLAESYW